MRFELHCHSIVSDGSRTPREMATRAAEANVAVFCLTDHDSFAGYEDTQAVLASTPCHVLCGFEWTCEAHGRTVHLLVYGLMPGPSLAGIEVQLAQMLTRRRTRIVAIRERLVTLGIDLPDTAFCKSVRGGVPGRPDVARALVRAGVCRTVREAFDRFLRDGGPADVPVQRLSLAQALELGTAAGAKMSLAHPHTFGSATEVATLFTEHREAGLSGIEAFYGRYGERERKRWLDLADSFGVCATGGTDDHGDMTPEVTRLGIDVSPPRADALQRWLEL